MAKKTFQAIKKLSTPVAAATATTLAAPDEAEATRIFRNRAEAMRLLERMTKGTGKLEPEKLMSEINAMGLESFDTKRALSDLLGSAVIETSPNMTRIDDVIKEAYPHLNLKNTPIKAVPQFTTPRGTLVNLDRVNALGAYVPNSADPLSSPIYLNPSNRDLEAMVATGFHEGQHSFADFKAPGSRLEKSTEAFTKAAENAAKKDLANKTKDLSIFAKTDEELKAIDPLYGISRYTAKHHEDYPVNFELEKLTERINQGKVVPSKQQLDDMFFAKYGKRASGIAPVSGIEPNDLDPITIGQDLYKGYNENIARPTISAIKKRLFPTLNVGNKEYETRSEVSDTIADIGFDPINLMGPVGEVLSAGQVMEVLPERKPGKFSIFNKLNK
jgi:hypothetical protein